MPELKERLKERGLDSTGKRNELVARLESALVAEDAEAGAAEGGEAAEAPAAGAAAAGAAAAEEEEEEDDDDDEDDDGEAAEGPEVTLTPNLTLALALTRPLSLTLTLTLTLILPLPLPLPLTPEAWEARGRRATRRRELDYASECMQSALVARQEALGCGEDDPRLAGAWYHLHGS